MADRVGVNGTRKEFRVVGKPNLPGRLSWAQATGVAKFGIDYVVPDMLEARFLRSPYANARIKMQGISTYEGAGQAKVVGCILSPYSAKRHREIRFFVAT